MTIGELDRRVTLEYPSVAANTYGEEAISSWATFRTVWAKAEWDDGSESEEADELTATSKVKFYIRNLGMDDFLNGVNAPTMRHRIKFIAAGNSTNKYYYIHSVEQIEGRDRFLKLNTEEKD